LKNKWTSPSFVIPLWSHLLEKCLQECRAPSIQVKASLNHKTESYFKPRSCDFWPLCLYNLKWNIPAVVVVVFSLAVTQLRMFFSYKVWFTVHMQRHFCAVHKEIDGLCSLCGVYRAGKERFWIVKHLLCDSPTANPRPFKCWFSLAIHGVCFKTCFFFGW